jgi:hypothetical protein
MRFGYSQSLTLKTLLVFRNAGVCPSCCKFNVLKSHEQQREAQLQRCKRLETEPVEQLAPILDYVRVYISSVVNVCIAFSQSCSIWPHVQGPMRAIALNAAGYKSSECSDAEHTSIAKAITGNSTQV